MPSTYSPLKIQLMATGENNTTWGDITNLNLGTALEEAIVGSADVTFASADVTLTLTDTNTSQTARNMRLRCTGTTGGSTRNLIVPSIEKPYIVKNDCADSVVVKTAAGTGITVPAGKTTWVYSDATNVVDAVTHLSSLTLGTDLAVSDGGTGASTFTANGVLYGNTTSALLATAAGTTGQVLVGNTGAAPSWATLTGIGVTSFSAGTTGLTPSSATTGAITLAGTLGVANGGTGTTTAFTAGSVVFAGASGVYTQDNTNFFWDDTNNRLGIGTATPFEKLEINGSIRTTVGSGGTLNLFETDATRANTFIAGANSSGAYIDSSYSTGGSGALLFRTIGSERMRITSAGDVGIGTNAPTAKLDVRGNFNNIWTTGVASSTLIGAIGGISNGYEISKDTSDNITHYWRKGDNSVAMILTSAGNVGIGNASPIGKLQVSSADGSFIVGYVNSNYYDADTHYFRNGAATVTSYLIPSASSTFLSTNTTLPLTFGTNNTERMRIDSSGNVGIGTSSPVHKLHVATGVAGVIANFTDGIAQTMQITTGSGWAGLNNANGGAITFGNNVERMRIDSSGNVGIGTSSVSSIWGTTVQIGNATGNGTYSIVGNGGSGFLAMSGSNFQLIGRGSTPLQLGTNDTVKVTIDTSGNVGIGTSSPGYKLEVNGTGSNIRAYTASGNAELMVQSAASGVAILDLQTSAGLNRIAGGVGGTSNLSFFTASTERMRITSGGDVGIGTSSPSSGLDVNGYVWCGVKTATSGGGGNVRYRDDTGTFRYAAGILGTAGATAFSIYDNIAATERMVITSTGAVGIGTASPSYPLEVRQDGASTVNYIGSVNTTATGSAGGAGYLARAGSNFAYFYVRGDGTAYIDNATANPLGFAVNGTERMRITSSGNVMVGTSTAGSAGFTVEQGSNISFNEAAGQSLATIFRQASSGDLVLGSAVARSSTANGFASSYSAAWARSAVNVGYGAIKFYTAPIATVAVGTDTTMNERMRIDSDGNVGIGTSSPAYKLQVSSGGGGDAEIVASNSAGVERIHMFSRYSAGTSYLHSQNSNLFLGTFDNYSLQLFTNNTERMRINSSGSVLVGTTTVISAAKVSIDSGAGPSIGSKVNATTALGHIIFENPNGVVGQIYTNGSATVYDTSSDVRLKHDIIDAPEASNLIDAIQVRSFKWNADNSEQRYGFIAQELITVAPEAVSQPADPDATMGVDYSKLVPMLVKEIQSMRARLAQLEGN